MSTLQFGWHMHSFPVDGSRGPDFVQQIRNTLDQVQTRFDSVWIDDHMMPWATWQSNDTPYLECMTTIAYFAAAYPSLTFGSSVLGQGYRNPGLMAKMAANLQLLTGGRFIFGIGAGWMVEEYEAYNWPFPKPSVRIAQMEEAIEIAKKMWREAPASYEGKYYRIDNAYCEPRPDPIPPILIGGGGEQLTLRVVAKHADWWNIPGGTLENYVHKLDVLRGHCDAVGRDYDTIGKSWSAEAVVVAGTEAEAQRIAAASPYNRNTILGTPEQVAEQLRSFVEAGVSYLIVRLLDFPRTDGIELFAEEVMPLLK
ncbi:MAG: LLM class flavin-dependent oxidoreductase [Caldilineaceae bacterium]|nr:LLM class flavin-dependent oxidoreductase [Caldilineaceae bacterium]